jgi:hypothetical protein
VGEARLRSKGQVAHNPPRGRPIRTTSFCRFSPALRERGHGHHCAPGLPHSSVPPVRFHSIRSGYSGLGRWAHHIAKNWTLPSHTNLSMQQTPLYAARIPFQCTASTAPSVSPSAPSCPRHTSPDRQPPLAQEPPSASCNPPGVSGTLCCRCSYTHYVTAEAHGQGCGLRASTSFLPDHRHPKEPAPPAA